MGYRSDIVDKVQLFLASQYAGVQSLRRDLTEVSKAALQLGYGDPFDKEQKAINDLLCQTGASDQVCLTVWAYYHDMKLNKTAV